MNLPLNIDLQQIFLHLFNFGILAGGLYLLLYKPVKDFMEKRMAYYQSLENEANEKLNHAKEIEVTYQNKMSEVDREISEKRMEAAQKAEVFAQQTIKEAKIEAKKIVVDAKKSAEEERQRILNATEKEIAELASAAAQKLVQESMDSTYDQFFESVKRG